MLFNSFEFLIFLPIVFILYWFVFKPVKWQNLLVVVASYVFYGWWSWKFLILIAITTLCSFLSGLLIEKCRTDGCRSKIGGKGGDWWVSLFNILLNLGILGVYKYYDFFVVQLADLLGLNSSKFVLNVILPVGISFYTFQALSYSIDVYRGKIKATRDLVEFAAYISFFPQLVAGPIERATNLLPQFQKPRQFNETQAADGMRQMLWGFFKKLIVADNCAEIANWAFDNYQEANLGGMMMFLGAVAFTFQIYGDFSGYSDIAIGTAKLFGITLRRNFNVPYFSRDVAEFWKRWHISLNSWFVDYIYIPLGGSREGRWKTIRNTFVIFLVSGLWHGANWTFVTWGAYHACLFVPLILLKKQKRYKTGIVAENSIFPSLKELIEMFSTFILVVFGWILFRAENIGQAYDYILTMFTHITVWYPIGEKITIFYYIIFMVLIEWFSRKQVHTLSVVPIRWRWMRLCVYVCFFVWMIVNRGNQATFIYFQF